MAAIVQSGFCSIPLTKSWVTIQGLQKLNAIMGNAIFNRRVTTNKLKKLFSDSPWQYWSDLGFPINRDYVEKQKIIFQVFYCKGFRGGA